MDIVGSMVMIFAGGVVIFSWFFPDFFSKRNVEDVFSDVSSEEEWRTEWDEISLKEVNSFRSESTKE